MTTPAKTFKVLTLNNISVTGLGRLPRERYVVGGDIADPDAIIVRSADMHAMSIPETVIAVGRAGAGTNNVPVAGLSKRGVAVFNAPGANANAVKELVLASLFLSARNICQAWGFVRGLDGTDAAMEQAIEKGKKAFVGHELIGRTLGVVGLGAVGLEVANAALALGMHVIGFDPQLSAHRIALLSAGVERTPSLDDLFARSEVITLHAPLMEETRNMVNADRLQSMARGGTILNFARGGIVDSAAILAALESGQLASYVCDFPSIAIKDHPRVIALPHLGASTLEAEENCATMVVDTLRDFLEHGTVRHSVNFPDGSLPRALGASRISVASQNVPSMVAQISTPFASASLNIANLLNKSRGDLAHTLIDVDGAVPESILATVRKIPGVLFVRNLGVTSSLRAAG